jgi:hypothetical protein
MAKPSNPNGSNQYLLDPRQLTCWGFYVDPKSETFGNAMQSAIRAGYEEATANQITTFEWFIGKRRRLNMLSKAEKVLDKALSYETDSEDENGKIKVQVDLLRVQTDVAKTVATTLGKDDGYSSKIELVTDVFSSDEKEALLALLNDQASS